MIPPFKPDVLPPLPAPEPVPTLLRDLVHERIGVYFESSRLDTLLEKLDARARAHECPSFLDYYYILKYEDKGRLEWLRVMDAFSVQETYFWRETDQINALVNVVVPAWFRDNTAPLRIWSAACATGEEPFSIAIALKEAGWDAHPIEINASDASEAALERARSGVYRDRSFRSLPFHLRDKYFKPIAGGYKIDDDIASRVKFHWANLVSTDATRDLSRSHVIFCRNVFIYFSHAAIKRTVEDFADHMPPSGHLFIGASESLLKLTQRFDLREMGGAFVYVKTDQP